MWEETDAQQKLNEILAYALATQIKEVADMRNEIIELKIKVQNLENSNQAKHISFAVQWTDRLLEESFNQGDEERELDLPYSPLCSRTETDRAGSQVNFIKYLVQPSFEVLGMMIPTVREEVNSIIESNLNFWETEQTTRQT